MAVSSSGAVQSEVPEEEP